MGISVPSSWITGLQAAFVLALTAGFLFDQPLTAVVALALSALLMTQDEEGAPAEYRPVTAILVLAGLLFLADYSMYAWGLSLLCAAFSLMTLLGSRFFQQAVTNLQQRGVLRKEPPARRRR